jgi:hypothetical protein
MILQTDNRLLETINKFGCYFMCILFLVNKYIKSQFNPSLINEYHKFFGDMKWYDEDEEDYKSVMDNDCFIWRPDIMANHFRLANRVKKVGPDYMCKPGEYEIQCWKRGKQKHFVVGDGSGHIAYDPMGVSRTTTEGMLESKRILWRN